MALPPQTLRTPWVLHPQTISRDPDADNRRLVMTINALRQDGKRTEDVMFWSLQARWHICTWDVWPEILPPTHPIVYISFKISLSGVVNDGHESPRLFSKQYIIGDAMMCSLYFHNSRVEQNIKGNLPALNHYFTVSFQKVETRNVKK